MVHAVLKHICHWEVTLLKYWITDCIGMCLWIWCLCLGAVWYFYVMSSCMEMYKCTLPAAAKQHAAEYLHEEDERRDSKICQILDWLQTQPHLNARCGLYQICSRTIWLRKTLFKKLCGTKRWATLGSIRNTSLESHWVPLGTLVCYHIGFP